MFTSSHDPIPLADSGQQPSGQDDRRPRIPEPLPVRLVTIDDAHLPTAVGCAAELDAFYVGMLGFERETAASLLIYRAENFSLVFDVLEPPIVHDNMRPLGIEVLSLTDAESKLIEAKIDYERQRALHPGQESLLLQDPAGNWIELTATAPIR
jgi:hypothetical protein